MKIFVPLFSSVCISLQLPFLISFPFQRTKTPYPSSLRFLSHSDPSLDEMREGVLTWRPIPGFQMPQKGRSWRNEAETREEEEEKSRRKSMEVGMNKDRRWPFASVSVERREENNKEYPTTEQFLRHPLALLAFVPREVSLFGAGALAGAAAKTLTAPLDRVKLLMQTHGLRVMEGGAKNAIGFIQAMALIGKEEGIKGYWKGNLPQVIRIIPYSAVQLFAYESYKKLFRGKDGELSVVGRLVAGACAGMTSTLATYPLDVLRLRLAVEPGSRTMSQVALTMLREEGIASFYSGLGPSLIGIAPYIAVNFCIFDLAKKSLPEKYQKRPESSLATALLSATLATLMCYPLDTVRRQMQMRGSPYRTVLDAFPGIMARDGFIGLYRGFVPNALKNLPSSSIRLTTFDTVKGLIEASHKELQRIMEENKAKLDNRAKLDNSAKIDDRAKLVS